VKTPIRLGFLLAPFSAVLLALGGALLLPSLVLSGNTAQKGQGQELAPAERCHPLAGEDANFCKQMVELEVRDVVPLEEAQTHAVLLVSKDGSMLLPIFVDEASAVAIAFRLAHLEPPHPLAQDLLDDVVVKLGGKVSEVRIDGLQDDIFVGRLIIKQGARDVALEARPSDSIAMALTGNAPILAHRKVLDEAGISKEEVDSMMNDLGVGGGGLPGEPGAEPKAEPLPRPPLPPRGEPDEDTIHL
jgi:uncharacterized protein